ncbi:hypothetical protein BMG_6251 (plasmid) [Priestia megaterium]|nr:hypothetical protein BMG_6251 [Priestia megaterium]
MKSISFIWTKNKSYHHYLFPMTIREFKGKGDALGKGISFFLKPKLYDLI